MVVFFVFFAVNYSCQEIHKTCFHQTCCFWLIYTKSFVGWGTPQSHYRVHRWTPDHRKRGKGRRTGGEWEGKAREGNKGGEPSHFSKRSDALKLPVAGEVFVMLVHNCNGSKLNLCGRVSKWTLHAVCPSVCMSRTWV